MKTQTEHTAPRTEDGSIFTVLLGGIAMIALISLSLFQLMSGPLTSASQVTQHNLAQTEMLTMSRIAIVDAANQSNQGDCDTDLYIEPRAWRAPGADPAPVNGGLIPMGMGAATTDAWGTPYGYCVWDVGPTSGAAGCGGGTGMLAGAPDPHSGKSHSRSVLAVISAGPDQTFQTTCNAYVDADTDVITTAGDDIIQRFSYDEAASTAPSLWTLKTNDPETAEIDKNLDIGSNINLDTASGLIQATRFNTTGKTIADGGVQLGDQTTVVDADCSAATAGLLRFNANRDTVELCLNSGTWGLTGNVNAIWPLRAPNGAFDAPSYSFENFPTSGMFHDAERLGLYSSIDNITFGPASGTDYRMISNGGAQAGYTNVTCDATSQGTLRYIESNKNYELCDGNDWITLYPGNEETIGMLIVTGEDHSCARRTDGSLWCWGENNTGKIGDGTSGTSRLSPVEVSGGATWKSILDTSPIFGDHSCGVKTDGTGWCWGANSGNGKLGDGTTNDSLVPVEVAGNYTWKMISAASVHTCGLQTDGTAWCWGQNDGSFGDGSWNNSKTPVAVTPGDTWKTIAASDRYTCGIKSNDTAWCWGRNNNGWGGYEGRLGNGTTNDKTSPTAVSGGGTWKKIDLGTYHTCGIKSDDTAWCWGYNYSGEIGDGSPASNAVLSPVTVSGGGTWKDISAGYYHTCGIKSDDTAWCWGRNQVGQLGNGTTNNSLVPVGVSGGATWKEISTGSYYTCGVKTDDTAWCWGGGWGGQTGLGSTAHTDVPTEVSSW